MKILLLAPALLVILVLNSCGSSRKTTTTNAKAKSGTATYQHLFYTGAHKFLDENTFKLDSVSTDETYAFTIQNPVLVGGENNSGVKNEQRFLNALLGPNGEAVTYNRLGSCCVFDSPNGFLGGGLLDKYEVKIEGHEKPFIIYINMYDKGILRAPKGFTFRD
jgi:hypothetical protein